MISAISVKDRLKKRADQNGKTMQEMLIVYGLERTIFRISVSEYADRFTLKGGGWNRKDAYRKEIRRLIRARQGAHNECREAL